MASSTSSTCFTWAASESDIDRAKSYACSRLSLDSFKPKQSEALDVYLRGRDMFVSLPTGFGKSVIFQAAPICWDFLHDVPNNPDIPKALAIVVVPLKSLALNQLARCQTIGLEAAIAISEIADDVMESAAQGKYSVLFASPEALLSDRGREFLQLESVYHRLCALFVDESHCVSKWGQSSGKTTAFRKMYGNIGELRSCLRMHTPVIAMTATASSSVRRTTCDSLSMRNVSLIHASPVLGNIKHIVHKTKLTQAEDILGWLCSEVTENGANTERVIVYLQSRQMCGELFSLFRSNIPKEKHHHFNMYHTNTEPEIQEHIMESFADPNGSIRVLFATIAFGLGVDVKGVHNVIMFGTPTDIDDYVQLSGRAGRDGTQSYSIVIKFPSPGSMPVKEEMKLFLDTESCRRDAIHAAFPVSQQVARCDEHNCCDNCARKCSCQLCSTLSYVEKQLQTGLIAGPKGSEVPIRSVTEEARAEVRKELLSFREQNLESSGSSKDGHVYAGPDIACGLPSATVEKIVNDLHLAFSYSQFCSNYQFTEQKIARHVWEICHKHTCNDETVVIEGETSHTSTSSEAESEASDNYDEYREAVIMYSDSD